MKVTQNNKSFSKEYSLMTKGILISMLLAHHVFFPDDAMKYGIDTITSNTLLFYNITSFFRICIAGFAFLTAYGMVQTFKAAKDDDPVKLFFLTVKRLVKLEFSIIIVYILAIAYRGIVVGAPIKEQYAEEGESVAVMLLHMVIDMTGMSTYAQTSEINVTWWYLSYAILLIVAMPFIYLAYKKFRFLLIPAGCLLPYAIMNTEVSFSVLFPAVILGTAFSYENWFEKLRCRNKRQAVIGGISCLVLIWLAYMCYIHASVVFSFLLVWVIPYFVYQYVSEIPVVNVCLQYIGKHATNMFLIHTFIYHYYYADFIYSFHSVLLIFPVLLGISLAVSAVIEWVKKYTGYNWLTAKVVKYIEDKGSIY